MAKSEVEQIEQVMVEWPEDVRMENLARAERSFRARGDEEMLRAIAKWRLHQQITGVCPKHRLEPNFTPKDPAALKAANAQYAMKHLRNLTPESVERIRDMVRSTDERVAMVAAKEVLDRTLGKPGDMPQGDDDAGGAPDLTNLSPADRIELSAALATVKRLTGRGPGAL